MIRPLLISLSLSLSLVTLPSSRASADASSSSCVAASEKGNDARDRGALRAARAHFVTCAADVCHKSLRADCAHWLEEVDAAIPSIVVGAKDAHGADIFDVRVKIDGEPVDDVQSGRPVTLDPGPHVVRFERGKAPDVETKEIKVLLRTGERNRAVLATMGTSAAKPDAPREPTSRSSGIPTPTWIFGGLGVVGLGVFGTFAIIGTAERSRLRDACSPGCTDGDVANLKTDFIVADVALGVGIVSLGIATYFLLTNKDTTPAALAPVPQRFARTIWK